jgi:hypothetical protein
MYNDEYYRFITDEEGKQIAYDMCAYFNMALTATTDTYNHLDGKFKTKNGNTWGMEVKNMGTDRYDEWDDILIAKDKYNYATNEGKTVSGLTDSIKIDYVKFNDEKPEDMAVRLKYGFEKGDVIAFITKFSYAQGCEIVWPKAPTKHTPNAPKKKQPFYSVPREKAIKYKLTLDDNGHVKTMDKL